MEINRTDLESFLSVSFKAVISVQMCRFDFYFCITSDGLEVDLTKTCQGYCNIWNLLNLTFVYN